MNLKIISTIVILLVGSVSLSMLGQTSSLVESRVAVAQVTDSDATYVALEGAQKAKSFRWLGYGIMGVLVYGVWKPKK